MDSEGSEGSERPFELKPRHGRVEKSAELQRAVEIEAGHIRIHCLTTAVQVREGGNRQGIPGDGPQW